MVNKLVRDKIPAIIEASASRATFKVLDEVDYADMLDKKLAEELDEYLAAESVDQVGELADLVEVVYAILESRGITIEEFEKVRIEKKEQRGGFSERLLLIQVED